MLVGCATFFNSTQLYRNSKNGLIPKFKNETLVTYFFLIAGAFMTIVCLYLIIAYCYLLYVLRKNSRAMKKTALQKSRTQIKKKEMKLFIMSSITVAIQISALCLFVSYATSILVISLDKFYLLYNAISDLYAGINPYLLWIFSDSLRKHILVRLGFSKGRRRKQPSSSVLTVVVH
ncbi:CBN-SRV-11 protein [Caenorhabditis brenneri]|uniref:CBN-SRV-11 protein n=1 Tax=Caenorhabditis brenneri TaxID=135651 RepID=G0MR75_CAEBE|nr:CBN-SRV-11 protein [Caenorhabditis brenneri]